MSLSTGAIIGISFGSVILGLFFLYFLYKYYKRMRRITRISPARPTEFYNTSIDPNYIFPQTPSEETYGVVFPDNSPDRPSPQGGDGGRGRAARGLDFGPRSPNTSGFYPYNNVSDGGYSELRTSTV